MDATKVRLSDHFLLSDFLGCTSVYQMGHPNKVTEKDRPKLAEGGYLCENLLEKILAEHGPLSVFYGYISPNLSERIVKYQDPRKPSYHRWDYGAACDIIVHDWVQKGVQDHEGDDPESAPILLAHEIDVEFDYSRMITYSESPGICVATRSYETPRRAFYENRYQGEAGAKPHFITYPASRQKRQELGDNLFEIAGDLHDWRGRGYPSYHMSGRKGYEHTRVSKYSLLSDFLYSQQYVEDGTRNRPPTNVDNVFWVCADSAGRLIDEIVTHLDTRVSITRGYESGGDYDWVRERAFMMDVTLPVGIPYKEISELVSDSPEVSKVSVLDFGQRLVIKGKVQHEGIVDRASNGRRVAGSTRW